MAGRTVRERADTVAGVVPLAPATKLAGRLPDQHGRVLDGLGVPVEFVLQEVGSMSDASYAKTANRSVVGSMNDFAVMADVARAHGRKRRPRRAFGRPCQHAMRAAPQGTRLPRS
jgi:hypothetical protein